MPNPHDLFEKDPVSKLPPGMVFKVVKKEDSFSYPYGVQLIQKKVQSTFFGRIRLVEKVIASHPASDGKSDTIRSAMAWLLYSYGQDKVRDAVLGYYPPNQLGS